MSTRMLLEGTDIRALLAQIREEYGPEARIVHAERIRSGGVGGFFAKQRFEVAVELDDSVLAQGRRDDDADSRPVAQQAAQPFAAAFPQQAAAPADAAPPPDFAQPPTAAPSPAAVMVEPLRTFDETAAALGVSAPGASAVDLVLGSLPQVDDPAFARQTTSPSAAPLAAGAPTSPSLVPSALIARGPLDELPVERAVRESRSVPEGLVRVGPRLTEGEPDHDLASRLQEQRATALAAAAAAAAAAAGMPQPAAPSYPTQAPAAHEKPADESDLPRGQVLRRDSLDDSGAPHLAPVFPLPTSHAADDEPATTAATEPVAPSFPSRPGDILVLLGDPEAAYRSAVALAARFRIPSRQVFVVSVRDDLAVPDSQVLHDLLEARLRGATLAHDRTAGIVVIDAPIDLAGDPVGAAWVADAAAAVGGSATWALVDATRRVDHLQRWIDCLPEPVALAVHNHAAAFDPHDVEKLSLPVAVADGVLVPPARAAAASAAPSTADHLADTTQRRTS